jgi:biotin carboxylase
MRILVLSHTTGYQLRAFNDAAAMLGIELVFASDRCHKLDDPWQDHAVPVRFHEPSVSLNAIVDRHLHQRLDGLVAVGDRPVVLAALAANTLGLPWHPVLGALASSDKRRSRAALAAAGLPAPPFTVLSTSHSRDHGPQPTTHGSRHSILGPRRVDGPRPTDHGSGPTAHGPRITDPGPRLTDLDFPVVLKPVGLSGSRGVIRANDEREYADAFERIRALMSRPEVRASRTGLEDLILVERYIEGREFAIEGVLTRGTLNVFAVFDKPDRLEGPFFEETIYVTPAAVDPAVRALIVDHVARGAAALGLWHGPVHAECRVTARDEVFVLEIAGRPIGGLCSRVLTFRGASGSTAGSACRSSLEAVLLRHAIGESIDGWEREPEAAAVMMVPIPARGLFKGVSGEEAARAVPGVIDLRITAKIGQLLETLPEAGSYLGFIFARAATAGDAERALREAHARLTFEIAGEIAVNR